MPRRWTGTIALVIFGLLIAAIVALVPDDDTNAATRPGSRKPRVEGAHTPWTAAPPAPTAVAPIANGGELAPSAVPAEVSAPPPNDSPRSVMLIGDSMAYTAAEGLAPHAANWNFAVVNEGIMGCGVVRGGPFRYFGAQRDFEPRCDAWPAAWQAALDRNHPDLVAIVVGRWELMDRVYDGAWTNVFDARFVTYVESELDLAISIIIASGARVVVFTTPYYLRGLAPDGGIFPEDDPARVDAMNMILRRVAGRHGVPVVDVGAWLSPEGRYTPSIEGVKVRSDGVHLTRQTGALMAPWLFPQLRLAAP